ncbi:dTMP kinase [Oleomonas cavernae]|uniref:Thymidylate kinase n=1 Tax=Oleomonas cavernae TaxID=2320859 RepID=A0A418WJ13_9PROT|nr:dTMP kinase [Oleomonas cavernae]
MARGRFITLEGGEGAGKSTQAARLAAALDARGIEVLLTREPGGTPGAEAVRGLLVEGAADRWVPLAETLLHMAARAEHVTRRVLPALAAGSWVICDRFVDSTIAYQGVVQGLGVAAVRSLHRAAFGSLMPDLTLVIDVDPAVGLGRAQARSGDAGARYERMGQAFHTRLRAAFLDLARAEPARMVVIDGGQAPDAVAADLLAAIDGRGHGQG